MQYGNQRNLKKVVKNMEDKARIEMVSEGLLDVRQAEEFSGLRKSKLYALMSSGELAYCKVGAARRIPKKALSEFLAKNLVVR